MKEQLNQWLTARAPVAGVQVCGLRHPDGTTFTERRELNFTPEAAENAWRCVADTFQVLKHHRLPALSLRWVFEASLLHCRMRPDGTCLMVFTTRKPQDLDLAALQALFDEFERFGS